MARSRGWDHSSNTLLLASRSSLERPMTTVIDAATAGDALKFSGYSAIDFTIKEDAMVYEAVQKFAAFNIGCLVTTDAAGMLIVNTEPICLLVVEACTIHFCLFDCNILFFLQIHQET
jgi:hypothetical protein